MSAYLDQIRWNADGLVPVVTQALDSGRVLMLAWANREAVAATVAEQRAVYWSRSRQRLWRKGEESGNVQKLVEIYLDCDNDCLCYVVEQLGYVACHTGRESCFYRKLSGDSWQTVDPVIRQPDDMYPSTGRK
ncbi:MAG: phosphoribosyl-AMP cyclohydrolase [Pseudomonadota bacterium]|jgi:phosphoribosyl-AMP cyclohydrolase